MARMNLAPAESFGLAVKDQALKALILPKLPSGPGPAGDHPTQPSLELHAQASASASVPTGTLGSHFLREEQFS